jgi:hypothetical protein
MVRITAIKMVGSEHHQHISDLRWVNPDTQATGESTRAAMVEYVRKTPNGAYVQSGANRAYLKVVETTPPYVQTYADNTWTDNLLALPRFN